MHRPSPNLQLHVRAIFSVFRNRRPSSSPAPRPHSVYQPPNAVHCPECDVCVEGYDHHCPWMGTCIGSRNYTPFLVFNLTWLFYLLYAILWVSFVGGRFGIRPSV